MYIPLTYIKPKSRNILLPSQALHPLLPAHSSPYLEGNIPLCAMQTKPLSIPKDTLSHTESKASSSFQRHPCNSFPVPTVIHNCLLSVHIYVHNIHTLSASRHADRHAHTHPPKHHPQKELQVPLGSESLVDEIINFLMIMNITQRQPPGHGGTFPANIHAIRIFGFTHPQLLLSAVLMTAKLSSLHWLGRPPGSGWLAWMVEDS